MGRIIIRRTEFLEDDEGKWIERAFIWIEKVTYGSWILSEMYCLTSPETVPFRMWSDKTQSVQNPGSYLGQVLFVIFKTSDPCKEPEWKLFASNIEGSLLALIYHRRLLKLAIFPIRNSENPKYLRCFPFRWTLCNNATMKQIPTKTIVDMMTASILRFKSPNT